MNRQIKRDSEAPENLLIRQAQEGNPAALNTFRLLPANERELLLLRFCGLAIPQIARILDSSIQSVLVELSHIRAELPRFQEPLLRDLQVERYHELIDRRLAGALSHGEERELQEIEKSLENIEDAETFATDWLVEEHHHMLMQQLDDLTTELRKFSAGSQASEAQ